MPETFALSRQSVEKDPDLLTVIAGPADLDHALPGGSAQRTACDAAINVEDVEDHVPPRAGRPAGQVRAAGGARLEKVWRPGARGHEGPEERVGHLEKSFGEKS